MRVTMGDKTDELIDGIQEIYETHWQFPIDPEDVRLLLTKEGYDALVKLVQEAFDNR